MDCSVLVDGRPQFQQRLKARPPLARQLPVKLREVRRAHWNTRDEPRSAEVVLKTFEQELKLWGLDAPTKAETKTTVGFGDDLSDEELERRWQEARKRDAEG